MLTLKKDSVLLAQTVQHIHTLIQWLWDARVDAQIIAILVILRLIFVLLYALQTLIIILKMVIVQLLVQEVGLLILKQIVPVYKLVQAFQFPYMEILFIDVWKPLVVALIYLVIIIHVYVVHALALYLLEILLHINVYITVHQLIMGIIIPINVSKIAVQLYRNMLITLLGNVRLFVLRVHLELIVQQSLFANNNAHLYLMPLIL